jgi:G3E family GTPase
VVNQGRDLLGGKIPVTVITGFLGSGKTTLISNLVKHPNMNRVAVVINEVGEIGIDHDLVSVASENMTLLANGCICCSVRTDMQETLRELFAQRQVGEVFDFDRVMIETTGLADPAPVLQTLVSDTLLEARYRLDGVITLVDAVNGQDQLFAMEESQKQVALADRLLVTKSDLTTPEMLDQLKQDLARINPSADIFTVLNGQANPEDLIGLGLGSSRINAQTFHFIQGIDLLSKSPEGGKYLAGVLPRAHSSIKTLSLRFKVPFTWEAFSSALELLAKLRGPDLLRVKGILNVQGDPLVVQGVQHIFHNPVKLERWPSDDHNTRLVFITRNIDLVMIEQLFNAVSLLTERSC